MPPHMRQELELAVHKAQVSAVAAGCQEHFDVDPAEVVEWRRLRESRVLEAKRKCAVELALTTNKVLASSVHAVCFDADFERGRRIFIMAPGSSVP